MIHRPVRVEPRLHALGEPGLRWRELERAPEQCFRIDDFELPNRLRDSERHAELVSLAEGVTGRCPDADLEPSSCLSKAALRTDARTRGLSALTWLPLARRSCSHGVTTDTLIRLSRGAARSSDNLPSLTVPQLTVGGCAFTIVDSSS